MRTDKEVLIFVFRRSENEEQILLTHRSPELGGYWHTVAGGIEDTESDDEAALRELREETGLDGRGMLDPRRHFYSYSLTEEPPSRRVTYPPGSEQIFVTCFRLDSPPGWEPSLNSEHDDFRWCGLEEALSLLRWPTVSKALVALSGKAHS